MKADCRFSFMAAAAGRFSLCLMLICCAGASAFAVPLKFNPNPYDFSRAGLSPLADAESSSLPQWAQDLRRAEIITLGAIPFVALGVGLTYSTYRYFANGMQAAYFPNPFAKSSSDSSYLSTEEQIGIVCATAGISLAIGLTDFIWNYIERKQAERAERESRAVITVTPLSLPDIPGQRVHLPLPGRD